MAGKKPPTRQFLSAVFVVGRGGRGTENPKERMKKLDLTTKLSPLLYFSCILGSFSPSVSQIYILARIIYFFVPLCPRNDEQARNKHYPYVNLSGPMNYLSKKEEWKYIGVKNLQQMYVYLYMCSIMLAESVGKNLAHLSSVALIDGNKVTVFFFFFFLKQISSVLLKL